MYNRLFEWLQQHQSAASEELVWGFGNAKYACGDKVVNGPLLEVLMEVELARDGALLVRPRQHTGVALNRQVVSVVSQDGNANSSELLSTLYKTVSEMETSQLSPGQPSTYAPFLKQLAMQLSSNGIFTTASEYSNRNNTSSLVVTDAWCLSCRPKPSTVWARDASDLAEQLLLSDDQVDNSLSRAAWALTHGSGALEQQEASEHGGTANTSLLEAFQSIKSVLLGQNSADSNLATQPKPLFSLPTSNSQEMIADLLLNRNFPAVVCEGPPGTGKTHTIANIVCAYLCQGKRVCVTSKGAPALAVLRHRLPKCVQELCVDVSMSESTGMRQLQQTVERLSDRVSCVNSELQTEKCRLLRENIDELEQELLDIDEQLESHNEDKRRFLTSPEGQELAEMALSLLSSAPWLMKTLTTWTVTETKRLHKRVESLVLQQDNDPIHLVTGYSSPPSDALVSTVAAHAGETLSVIMKSALKTISSVPGLGSVSGDEALLQEQLDALMVDGRPPETRADWQLTLCALRHDQAVHAFHRSVLDMPITREGWPLDAIYVENFERRRINQTFLESVSKALRLKQLASDLDVSEEVKESIECSLLDGRRTKIAARIQLLAENMVEQTVVAELRKSFSAEAQSALIKFAQIAGKSRFSKASQPSKMSQRQRRHRQEYLDAFEKCVRYTPCWILTSAQISDYLPSETGLFDLVIIDEASQSDITVLPGMLRGKQWLIVGDGKQVSPSESFISEAQIDSLRAALPESPLADSLLPGHSFFDLCAQAFPTGRVVLSEHFRCAPEIIDFSNSQFYDGRLIPLRLPTKSERMTPCIVDVRVEGTKVGKVNEKECDTIVSMVQELVEESSSRAFPRSIGIISLIGDEQSRLVRGRLLDAIGPQKYKEHNILIGDPPTFQGAEKDVVFLSLVCSAGSVPTQNQQMHAQRANVALSRARDRMVLVRSIDSRHVPNRDDVKIPIIEFFETAEIEENGMEIEQSDGTPQCPRAEEASIFSFRVQAEAMLETLLRDGGYSVRRMGIVWGDAICVENVDSALRAAVCIDCAGEPKEEWRRVMTQQKSIERVGWRCMRVDALSFLSDFHGTFNSVKEFLTSVGVEPMAVAEENAMVEEPGDNGDAGEDDDVEDEPPANDPAGNVDSASIVVISSDDEEGEDATEELGQSEGFAAVEIKVENDGFDPEQFGDVVDLGFLQNQTNPRPDLSVDENISGTTSEAGGHVEEDGTGQEVVENPLVAGEDVEEDGTGQEVVENPLVAGADAEEDGTGQEVVELDDDSDKPNEESDEERNSKSTESQSSDEDEAYLGESESGNERTSQYKRRKRRKYRRLDRYSRDGRWYPGRGKSKDEDALLEDTWYDTDSDLVPDPVLSNEGPADSQGKTPQE